MGTRNVITGASYVNGALAVPSSKNVGDNGTTTKVPVLAPSHHQYPSAPWRESHAIAVVEVHDILEQPTPPPRTAERSTEPKFIPETDSGCELPLGAKFTTPPRFVTTGAAQLRKPLVNRSGACIQSEAIFGIPSKLNIRRAVPIALTIVTPSHMLVHLKPRGGTMHAIEESEDHPSVKQDVYPMLADALRSVVPKFTPDTVTRAPEPELLKLGGAFGGITEVSTGAAVSKGPSIHVLTLRMRRNACAIVSARNRQINRSDVGQLMRTIEGERSDHTPNAHADGHT